AHVLELLFELDLLGDGDAILGDAGSAERLVEDNVAALAPNPQGKENRLALTRPSSWRPADP
ncbi:hypothetical protein, partial [Bradyrhizobium sp. Mp27]|uniref:hypothetical protein n=1 Tax=Bradyrhizobium sp. Mp27 TaxID=3042157 RepID=UPI00248AEE51